MAENRRGDGSHHTPVMQKKGLDCTVNPDSHWPGPWLVPHIWYSCMKYDSNSYGKRICIFGTIVLPTREDKYCKAEDQFPAIQSY
jgi:hypothetical protein